MNIHIKIVIVVLTLLIISIFPLNINAQESSLEPIVLVPGIMGSWNWEVLLGNSNSGTWDFFVFDHTWDNMVDALEKAGYEKDKTLFVAFYDWRQSNMDSAINYLIPTIDKALLNSSTGKVSIVAHSMGGLVARRYIESNSYRNDVDHLILLGTPNYGSSDVYTLWEGGVVPTNWDKKDKAGIDFILWVMTGFTTQTADNYDTIHTYILSVKELLPTYDFLTDLDGNIKPYYNLIEANNPFLDNLNYSDNMHNLQNVGNITVVAGDGENTVKSIPVAERPTSETKLWKDGMPNPMPPVRNSAEGDNRVLLSSAYLDPWSIVPPVPVLNNWQKFFPSHMRLTRETLMSF